MSPATQIVVGWVCAGVIATGIFVASWNNEHSLGMLIGWGILLSGVVVGIIHRALYLRTHRSTGGSEQR